MANAGNTSVRGSPQSNIQEGRCSADRSAISERVAQRNSSQFNSLDFYSRGSGPGGRWFKSTRPDQSFCNQQLVEVGPLGKRPGDRSFKPNRTNQSNSSPFRLVLHRDWHQLQSQKLSSCPSSSHSIYNPPSTTRSMRSERVQNDLDATAGQRFQNAEDPGCEPT